MMVDAARTGRAAVCAALVAAFAFAGGCNIVAGAAYIIEGPPKIEAQHKLEEKRATVFFIDDRSNVVPRRSLRAAMGLEADQTLLENKGIDKDKMLASQSALSASAADRTSKPKSITSIGKAVGAEVVVYVDMRSFTLSQDGASYQPSATAVVKVIDVANNRRIWPAEGDGWPLKVQPPVSGDAPKSVAEKNKAETALAKAAGKELARLFFTYEREGASRARTAQER